MINSDSLQSAARRRGVSMMMVVAVLAAALFAPMVASAQSPGGGERELRDRLQRVYRAWSAAMRDRNYEAWKNTSTSGLQTEVRNQIVSQKLRFPSSLFDSPLMAPQVSRLRFVRAREVGNEAQLVYYGRFDVGLDKEKNVEQPENLLVIWFGKENGAWAVGRIQMLDLEPMPGVRAKMKRFDYSFLDQPQFTVDGKLPAPAKRAPTPDYVGKVFVISFNENTKVTLNGVSTHRFAATRSAQLVMGGFKRGENTIRVDVTPLADDQKPADSLDDNAPYVIRLYMMPDDPARQLPVIIWRYEPEDGKAPAEAINETFVIDDQVVDQRYRKLKQ